MVAYTVYRDVVYMYVNGINLRPWNLCFLVILFNVDPVLLEMTVQELLS